MYYIKHDTTLQDVSKQNFVYFQQYFRIIANTLDIITNMKILLNKLMYEKNISFRKLSEVTGIPKSTLYDIARERHSPTLNNLELIAKALDVRISNLYESEYK